MEQEIKDDMLKLSLLIVDDVNILLETNNYQRKYSPSEYIMPDYQNDMKRFMVTARENLRKILQQSWLSETATVEEQGDINTTLILVKNKITQLFAN